MLHPVLRDLRGLQEFRLQDTDSHTRLTSAKFNNKKGDGRVVLITLNNVWERDSQEDVQILSGGMS